MAGLANAPRQVAEIWRQVGINQKLSILLVGLGSAAAICGFVFWGGRPSYGLLYSRLSRADAAAVVAQLEAEAVPYRVEDGGTTVLVASDRVQASRGKLLSQGIPSGGDGFEILDKRTLGMTDFAERKTYLRAVQGELARTISSVDQVEWARVHISAPEPSVFLDRDTPATASVLLKVQGGGQLSSTQVASITSFVARSVEGLDPKNVTITDQFLNALSRKAAEDGPGSATAHLEAQTEIERRLTRKVQDMLDASLGPNRSSVSVSADIVLKQEELHTTEFTVDGRVAKKESTTTTKSSDGSDTAGGAAGTASNLPPAGGARAPAAPGHTSSESREEIEYEIPKKDTVRIDHGVTVSRLTVSVLVAGTHTVEKGADGKETRKFQPLPEAELTKLTDAVKQAVGFDQTRTDVVKVECMEFNEPAPAVTDAEAAGERRWSLILRLAKHGSTGVIVLAFLLIMRSKLRKARGAREAAAAESRKASTAAAAAAGAAAGQSLRQRVATAAQSNPDAASELLKSWYRGAPAGPAAASREPRAPSLERARS